MLLDMAQQETAAALRWARSGLMALTGPANAAPLVPAFDAAAAMQALFEELQQVSGAALQAASVDFRWLTERARLLGFHRDGQRSCNGSCRMIEARDGWLAANLPRPTDFDLLPAWLGVSPSADPWSSIAAAVRCRDSGDLLAVSMDLGLAVAAVPLPCNTAPTADFAKLSAEMAAGSPHRNGRPLVVDLSTLWAGPLCGSLLLAAGARVIKVARAHDGH